MFISSAGAIKCLTVSPKTHEEDSLLCVVGAELPMALFLDKLTLWKYERVDHSYSPNTFACRGGILDVFPLYAKEPIRIEYFGNKIDSIRTYNPTTQLSSKKHSRFRLRPPVLHRNKQTSALSDSLALYCSYVLYITESGFSFLSGENKIDVFVDPLSFEGRPSSFQEKEVDRIFSQFSVGSVFYLTLWANSFLEKMRCSRFLPVFVGGFLFRLWVLPVLRCAAKRRGYKNPSSEWVQINSMKKFLPW